MIFFKLEARIIVELAQRHKVLLESANSIANSNHIFKEAGFTMAKRNKSQY